MGTVLLVSYQKELSANSRKVFRALHLNTLYFSFMHNLCAPELAILSVYKQIYNIRCVYLSYNIKIIIFLFAFYNYKCIKFSKLLLTCTKRYSLFPTYVKLFICCRCQPTYYLNMN